MSRGDGLVDALEIDASDFRFSQVPEDLSFDPDVKLQSKAIFAALQRYGASSGDRRVSYAAIGGRMGTSRDTIKRAVHDLAENGWAVVEERPGKPNRIKLLRSKLPRGTDDPGQICPDTQGTDAPGTRGRFAPRPIARNREQKTESNPSSSSATSRARGRDASGNASAAAPGDDPPAQPAERVDDDDEATHLPPDDTSAGLIRQLTGREPKRQAITQIQALRAAGWTAAEINQRLLHAQDPSIRNKTAYLTRVLQDMLTEPAPTSPQPLARRPQPPTPTDHDVDLDPDGWPTPPDPERCSGPTEAFRAAREKLGGHRTPPPDPPSGPPQEPAHHEPSDAALSKARLKRKRAETSRKRHRADDEEWLESRESILGELS